VIPQVSIRRSCSYGSAIGFLILVFLLGIAVSQTSLAQAAAAPAANVAQPARVAPVTIDGETLFLVRGVTAYPAEQRAENIRSRIIELAQDESFDVKGLVVREESDRSVIYAGDKVILPVYDIDAELENLSRALLAEVYARKIAITVTEFRQDRSASNLLENSLYALGATALLALLWWTARLLFRALDGWASRHVRRGVEELADKSHQLIHAGAIWRVISSLLRFVRTVIYLVLVYFYLNTVLGLYPWTRPFARILFKLILDPLKSLWQGFTAELPNLAFLLVLWFVVRYITRIVRAFFKGVEAGTITLENFEPEWAVPTFKIVNFAIIAFSLVIAYPYIPGSESAAFKGVSVFVGVLFSLGSSSFIANMIAGLSMTYRGAFRVGDRVKVGDVVGTIEDVKLMVTRIVTPKNERVIMPNSNILATEVVNYSQMAAERGVVLHSTVGIGYDTPWRQVEAMLLEAAARTSGLKSDPPPFVLQTLLGDYAVNYEINVYCGDANRMPALYSALHANIQDVFNEYGVQIMSPSYEADPDEPKVVPPAKWYEAPARKPEPKSD